jgi:hypothetical protein
LFVVERSDEGFILELFSDKDSSGIIFLAIRKGVMSGFDDHPRESLSGVWTIKIHPFLELNIERVRLNISDSNRAWIASVG